MFDRTIPTILRFHRNEPRVPCYGLTLRGTSAAVIFHVSEYNLVHVFIDRLNDTSICSL